jgi:hypothetical protein
MKKPHRIYRNLHKNLFSIQDYIEEKKGYRVTDRVSMAVLNDVEFVVYQSGREKVLRERKKNVHAFVLADSYDVRVVGRLDTNSMREIYYNPYEYNSFVYKDTGESLNGKKLKKVLIINNKVYEL